MKFYFPKFLIAFVLFFPLAIFAQHVNTDSIDVIVNEIKIDSLRLKKLRNLCNYFVKQRNLHMALEYTEKTLVLAKKLNANETISRILVTNIDMLVGQGDYKKALEFGLRYKKLAEKMNSKAHLIEAMNSIGVTYWYEGETKKALPYYEEALKLAKEINDERQISAIYNNFGIVYRQLNEYDKAIEFYNKSIILSQRIGNEEGIANAYNNIGVIYQITKDYPKALFYLNKSLEVRTRVGNKIGIATSLGNIGGVYFESGKLKEAEKFLLESHAISLRENDIEGIKEVSEYLSKLYEKSKKHSEALEYYKEFIIARDSLQNEELKRDALKNEMEYRFNKDQEKKAILVEAEKRKQKIFTYSIFIILVLVCVFSAFLFNRFRITSRQKKIIESQKKLVEEKNNEIISSISYAKRLQEAILPPEKLWKSFLPNSFILYKPKDIVAGDFYWLEHAENGALLVASADCTGHGVPGAMVNVVCSNAMNRAIKEFKLTEPGLILDKVRELVLETFEKSESDVKDGMDISFLSVLPGKEGSNEVNVQWAGANNPLWFLSPAGGQMLSEITADKQPIGKSDQPKPFTTHHLKISKGTTLYLFTDGYADQFGGPSGKKFKYKQLEDLLISIVSLEPDAQKTILEQNFNDWKGSLEQVDDVLVIGIRI